MTAYERLFAEEIPTGAFGGPRPEPPPPPPRTPRLPTTPPDEQARHTADLAAALAMHVVGQPKTPAKRRHLRVVPPAADEPAA